MMIVSRYGKMTTIQHIWGGFLFTLGELFGYLTVDPDFNSQYRVLLPSSLHSNTFYKPRVFFLPLSHLYVLTLLHCLNIRQEIRTRPWNRGRQIDLSSGDTHAVTVGLVVLFRSSLAMCPTPYISYYRANFDLVNIDLSRSHSRSDSMVRRDKSGGGIWCKSEDARFLHIGGSDQLQSIKVGICLQWWDKIVNQCMVTFWEWDVVCNSWDHGPIRDTTYIFWSHSSCEHLYSSTHYELWAPLILLNRRSLSHSG